MARLRLLSTAAREGGRCVRLYRWRWVREARIVLRLKLLQMGAAASLLLPVGGALASGAHVGGVEVAAGAGLAGGVYGLARTLGWLCDRLVGELAWKEGVLRISTLSMASRLHSSALRPSQLSPRTSHAALHTGDSAPIFSQPSTPHHTSHPSLLISLPSPLILTSHLSSITSDLSSLTS